jgi:hypothetical protein
MKQTSVIREACDLLVAVLAVVVGCSHSETLPPSPPDAAPLDAAADAPPASDTAPVDAAASPADGALPAWCAVTTDRPGPYDAVFRVINRSDHAVYLQDHCAVLSLQVMTCASRYTENVGPGFTCGCGCDQPGCTGPVACGPCAPDALSAIAPGQTRDIPWSAIRATMEDRTTFQCVRRTPLPAARYAVSVPLFDATGAPLGTVGREFPLPSAAPVELVFAPSPADAGADGPPACTSGAAPVCAAPFSPALTCDLDDEYSFGLDGGLSRQRDQSRITPPGRYTRTRTFADAQPPVSCSNDIPRCGATFDRFTTADLVEALSAPDVVAAFAASPPEVHGRDPRPVDGTLLLVQRRDGHGVLIGAPCAGGSFCGLPVTPGLAHLAAVLTRLDRQQLEGAGCEALRDP